MTDRTHSFCAYCCANEAVGSCSRQAKKRLNEILILSFIEITFNHRWVGRRVIDRTISGTISPVGFTGRFLISGIGNADILIIIATLFQRYRGYILTLIMIICHFVTPVETMKIEITVYINIGPRNLRRVEGKMYSYIISSEVGVGCVIFIDNEPAMLCAVIDIAFVISRFIGSDPGMQLDGPNTTESTDIPG